MFRRLGILGACAALGFGLASRGDRAPAPPPEVTVEDLDEADREAVRDLARLLSLARHVGTAEPVEDPFGRELAQMARYHLTHPHPDFRDDCSGFVSAVLTDLGAPTDGIVVTLWDIAVETDALHWELTPRVGDLVFFDNTYDRNDNGRWDDELTHIGVVVDVEPDDTAVIAHAGTGAGRSLIRMNLHEPSRRRADDGRVVNGTLRAGYTTADLWTAFATVDPLAWVDDTSEI